MEVTRAKTHGNENKKQEICYGIHYEQMEISKFSPPFCVFSKYSYFRLCWNNL